MESLEDALEKTDTLIRDLSAEIVIQEEIYREEEYYDSPDSLASLPKIKKIIEQPRKAEPDEKKRKKAREILERMYESSPWRSARYNAGIALKKPYKELEKNSKSWIETLEKRLSATKIGKVWENYDYSAPKEEWLDMWTPPPGCELKEIPDSEARVNALRDLAAIDSIYHKKHRSNEFLRILNQAYEKNDDKEARKTAGMLLGYSNFRVKLHEDPASIAPLIVLGLIGSGIGYLIYHCLAK